MTTMDDLVAAVAAHGLAGSRMTFSAKPLDAVRWQRFLARARTERLTGLLVDAMVAGGFAATEAQLDEATAAHAEAMALVLRLDRLMIESCALLRGAGFELRVLKGAAVALLDYPEPSLRCYGDVDLLVRSPDLGGAVDVLAELGFIREVPELRRGFDQRFGKGTTLVGPAGMEIDLHRTFVPGRFGLDIPLDELFTDPRVIRIATSSFEALSDVNRLLHACFHAAIGQAAPGLMAQRDVVQMSLAAEDWADAALDRARQWRCEAVVARAIRSSWDLYAVADTTALSAWAQRYTPRPEEVRAMRAYVGKERRYARQALGGLRAVHGVTEKASYVRAHLGARTVRRLLGGRKAMRPPPRPTP
jgi:hypothetical protein